MSYEVVQSVSPPPLEPDKIQNLHCRPQNSTAIACSWIPPDSDFDGYSIECRKMDTQEVEFSRKLEKEKSLLNIMMLVPHKRYLVSIKVQSAGVTSEVVEGSTITMIDRECPEVCPGASLSCPAGYPVSGLAVTRTGGPKGSRRRKHGSV